jgi:low affinity Fe/Cu permease
MIALWALSGPFFHFSQRWESIFTICTSIATFLMVFLLQRAQAKDVSAIHIKLNELLASHEGASNRMLNIESSSEAELTAMRMLHDQLPRESMESHSIEHVMPSEIIIAER